MLTRKYSFVITVLFPCLCCQWDPPTNFPKCHNSIFILKATLCICRGKFVCPTTKSARKLNLIQWYWPNFVIYIPSGCKSINSTKKVNLTGHFLLFVRPVFAYMWDTFTLGDNLFHTKRYNAIASDECNDISVHWFIGNSTICLISYSG